VRYLQVRLFHFLLQDLNVFVERLHLRSIMIAQLRQSVLFLFLDQILQRVYEILFYVLKGKKERQGEEEESECQPIPRPQVKVTEEETEKGKKIKNKGITKKSNGQS
jgi:hypothetical protein